MTQKTQRGLSLIELMIALAISAFLMVGLFEVYLNNRQSYRLQTGVANLQTNAQFSVQFLNRYIRMAGTPSDQFTGLAIAATNDDGENGSDSITISYESDRDCLFTATPGAPQVAINRFFIEDGDLKCEGNGGGGQTDILVDGIENMQLFYGIDTDGDGSPNRVVSAPDVADWDQVLTVRIVLLVTSIDEVADSPQPVVYQGVTITPSDRMIRRQIASTIAVRDRAL